MVAYLVALGRHRLLLLSLAIVTHSRVLDLVEKAFSGLCSLSDGWFLT